MGIKFKRTSEYPNYSLYVLEGETLKAYGGFSKRMLFGSEQEALEYLQKRRYLGKESENVPVLLVRYDAPNNSRMIAIV